MPQNVGGLMRLQHEVDGHEHGPEPREREAHGDEGMRVAREDGNAIAK
jgi:hypothetical protein